MRLAAHELHDLNELTLSCVNSITNMGLFINQAQDPELKAMLMRHYPYHIRDYNKKVEYLQETEGSRAPFPVPDLNSNMENFAQSPAPPAPPVTPRTNAQTLNDREIATAYLLNLKRAGREYAWATMEMSHPDLRQFLEDAFRMSARHAYDCWQYMAKKGWYPLQPAPQVAIQTLAGMYNLVPEQTSPNVVM
ncbi:MAG: spore coat protein [Bacillota bacterium]